MIELDNGFVKIENSDLFNISHFNTNAEAADDVARRTTAAEGNISDIQTALGTKVDTSTYTAGMATKVNSSTYNAGMATKVNYSTYTSGMAGKVDKVDGKGLSTEDYTTAEKTKLAGVEAGANAYTLPAATSGALGGVKQGANVSIAADGTLSATDTTYSAATQSAAGLMSAEDKTKLDEIPSLSAGRYIQLFSTGGVSNPGLQISSTAPQILQGTNVSLAEDSESCTVTVSATDTTYSPAVASRSGVGGSDGLMSAGDKEKLDGISTAALTYSSGNGWSGFGGVLSEIYFGDSGLATITINAQRSASNISGYIALNSSGTPLPKKPTSEVKVPIVSEEGKSLYVKIASGGTSVMVGRDDSDNWGAGVQTIHATIAFSAS